MGRVLRARDVVLDLPVALKVVRPDLAADHRFRKLFDLEVRISARFAHPHIVPLHDLGELGDGTPYLGLAFADGGSFAAFKEDQQMRWPEMLRLTLELLDALSHLHARDVLHRDLKPENVLLFTGEDGKKHVWVADLGLANAAVTLAKRKGRMEGTPGFMAPEQKLGLPREYGPWTDLYSTGVILWEMITGALPFPLGMTAMDAPLPALIPRDGLEIPDGLEVVLGNLLSPEPLSRYDLAADLRTELVSLSDSAYDARPREIADGMGTVAEAVPLPLAEQGSVSLLRASVTDDDEDEWEANATMFFELEAPRHDPLVPVWNRPKPLHIPSRMPRAVGLGATARASLSLFAVRELPVVARQEFQQDLWTVARQVASSGRPQVLVVMGEAGAGKTALVESVLHALEEGGWAETVTLSFQSPPGKEDGFAGAARALVRPWKESRASLVARLRRRLARARGANDAVVREEADMLARWAGLLESDEERVAEGYGLREMYRSLEARSWRGLSCLFLDDVQWAVEEGDGLSIVENVLQTASESSDPRQLLVICTVRLEDYQADRAFADRVDSLVALGARRISLPRLGREGTAELLKESLTLAPEIAEKVAERCEGNPLFARQLLIDWSARGWLVDTGGLQFGLAPGVDVDAALPDDAEALFAERIDTLARASGQPGQFMDALHMAALAGQTLPRDVLMRCAGAELAAFMRSSGLWNDQLEFAKFAHGLLYQSIRYQAMNRRDVSDLHRKLALVWRQYGEENTQDVAFEVGRHAHAGEDWVLAIEHLLLAAELAWASGRSKELEEASRLAVDACPRSEKLARYSGWATLWRARAFEARGEAVSAGKYFARALGLLRALGDRGGCIEALLGQGWAALQGGELDKSERHYSDAVSDARKRRELKLEAHGITGMAWIEQQRRNFEGADILFTRVLNRFTQLEDLKNMVMATLGQAYVARRSGRFEDADELYEEAITTAREADDLIGVARGLLGQGTVFRQLRRYAEAEERYRSAMGIAEDLGTTQLLMESQLGLAELFRVQGSIPRAVKLYRAHVRWAERHGFFESSILANLGLAMCAQVEGDLREMYVHANNTVQVLNKVPGHWLWATYRLVVATLLALRGDETDTYRWLWTASELGLGDTVDLDTAENLTRIAQVAHRHDWERTLKLAGKLGLRQWRTLGEHGRARELSELVGDFDTDTPIRRR